MNPRTALRRYPCVTLPLILRIELNGTLQTMLSIVHCNVITKIHHIVNS